MMGDEELKLLMWTWNMNWNDELRWYWWLFDGADVCLGKERA